MDLEHIFLQYNRLARHRQAALENRDPISFLDLSHSLRIWVDMKNAIDILAQDKKTPLRFTNTTTSKSIKKILKRGKHTYLPLGSGVESSGVQVKGVQIFNGVLSQDEIKKLYEAGPPVAQPTTLQFSEWLASGIYEVPSQDKVHSHIRISREILIKRVANILGASHPAGNDYGDERENKFDPYILELHSLTVSNGYPATYYQLLEIAGNIIDAMKVLFESIVQK